ncbi:hypothetical protein NM688_g3769 [Phlebia brevispora]|uniref:Uncharacterized protein n=1 Tax=Phlebia brevispora TaxID=194682 RepID=A0ACC1T501_9APHY|nr:hypothetical protein NM688_g3769 [Phlebia brevispora]
MSTFTPTSVIVAAYKSDLVVNNCINAALTFVTYEFLITSGYEYEFLWRRKWTAATWLFVTNRYLLLASIIVQIVPFTPQVNVCSHEKCLIINGLKGVRCQNFSLQMFIQFLINVPLVISALFSALRVFAILDRAYAAAGCVLLLGLTPLAVILYQASQNTTVYVHDPCFIVRMGLVSILATITVDVAAIIATWVKTYRQVREASSIGMSVSISAMLLRYGTLYFLVLCIVNLAQLLIYVIPSIQSANPINIFTNMQVSSFSIPPLSSRESSDTARFSDFSVPNFRVPTLPDVLGNLGEPLADDNLVFDVPDQEGTRPSEDASTETMDTGNLEEASGTSHATCVKA